MKAKEKAQELYKKLVIHIQRYDEYVDERSKINTKKCAIIAVEEILKAVDNPDETYLMKDSVNYWTEVKKEIEAL